MRFLPDHRFGKSCLASAFIILILILLFLAHWQRPNETNRIASLESGSTGQQSTSAQEVWDKGPFVDNPVPVSVLGLEKQRRTPHPGKSIMEIRFIDEVTKDPVTSGKIKIEPFWGPDIEVPLNDDGAITLAADPGEYTLRSTCQGFLDWRDDFNVPEGQARLERTVPLARLLKVHGIVNKANGEPQKGASVCFFQDGEETIATSGSGGLFEITAVQIS